VIATAANVTNQSASVRPPRLVVRPIFGPAGGMDVTAAVIDLIADQLAALHQGNDILNRIEAERLLNDALASLCAGAPN